MRPRSTVDSVIGQGRLPAGVAYAAARRRRNLKWAGGIVGVLSVVLVFLLVLAYFAKETRVHPAETLPGMVKMDDQVANFTTFGLRQVIETESGLENVSVTLYQKHTSVSPNYALAISWGKKSPEERRNAKEVFADTFAVSPTDLEDRTENGVALQCTRLEAPTLDTRPEPAPLPSVPRTPRPGSPVQTTVPTAPTLPSAPITAPEPVGTPVCFWEEGEIVGIGVGIEDLSVDEVAAATAQAKLGSRLSR